MTRGLWLMSAALGLLFATACDPDCRPGPGEICTWAGTGAPGFNGDGLVPEETRFYWPVDVQFTNIGTYVLDWNNHRVRRLTDAGTFATVVGTDFVGDGPDDLSDLTAEGAPGDEVHMNHPTQVQAMPDGKLLIVSWHNHKLRTWDPTTGKVHVLCGREAGFGGDGESSFDDILLNQPSSAVVTPEGDIVLLDQRNQRIRRIQPDGFTETLAGTGEPGFSGDGGAPLEARFNFPTGGNPPPAGGLAMDDQGRIYVPDTLNHRIRRIDLAANLIETVAGTGEAGFNGDGPATEAQINNPRDMTFGPDGRLYFADEMNHRVRALDVQTLFLETVAGTGQAGLDGDGGKAAEALFAGPAGVSFDQEGALYVTDTLNHRIRKVGMSQ
jgi:DNA-binding beta-propeller fold protein YncE